MIHNQTEFEAALEQAAALIDNPPPPGTPEDRRLGELLGEIARYRPQMAAPADTAPMAEEREGLAKRIEAFHRRYEAQKPKPLPGADDDGVGTVYGSLT